MNLEEQVKRGITTIGYQPLGNAIVVEITQIVKLSELASYNTLLELSEGLKRKCHPERIISNKVVAYGYSVYGIEIGDDLDIRQGGMMLLTLPSNKETFFVKKQMLGNAGNFKLKEGSKVYNKGVQIDVPDSELVDINGEAIGEAKGVDSKVNPLWGSQDIRIVEYALCEAHGILGIFKENVRMSITK